MVAKDTLIGIVGAVVLVAALAGVFYLQGSDGNGLGGLTFDVAWSNHTLDGPNATGTTDVGSPTNLTLAVPRSNLTAATFTLTWTDDVGSPDTFRLVVTSPDGTLRNASQDENGTVTVIFGNLNPVPGTKTVTGKNLDDAHQRLAYEDTSSRGRGNWSIEVICVKAQGFQPIPGGPPLQSDNGNAWSLQASLRAYAPKLSSR